MDTFIRPLGTSEWIQSEYKKFNYSNSGLIESVDVQTLGERDGEVYKSKVIYHYNDFDQIVERKGGTTGTTYFYNELGNIELEERKDEFVSQIKYTYDESWNPTYWLPIETGINILIPYQPFSYNNITSFELGIKGENPASKGVGETILKDEEGYPLRRELIVTNASTPDISTRFISEYTYLD